MNPQAALNSASHMAANGQVDEAAALLRDALRVQPDDPDLHLALASVLSQSGKHAEALTSAQRSLRFAPKAAPVRRILAELLTMLSKPKDAAEQWEAYLRLDSDQLHPYLALSDSYIALGDYRQAIETLRKSLAKFPESEDALAALFAGLSRIGEAEEAIETLQSFGEVNTASALSKIVFSMLYHSKFGRNELAEWHRRYGAAVRPEQVRPKRAITGNRRLRIGFVSGDFREHSVAYFAEPLLLGLDTDQFKVFAYHTSTHVDALTERFASGVAKFSKLSRQKPNELREAILADDLDILVELSGHTTNNILPLMAERLAPIQISAIGYAHASGLETMDFRLVDQWTDPTDDSGTSELLIRLERPFLAYTPNPAAPDPKQTLWMLGKADGPTFGSFNALGKHSPETLALWAEILRQVPTAKLLMKGLELRDPWVKSRFQALFAALGIETKRLTLLGVAATTTQHLAKYGEVDVALDPFPYNGTTTTCEALWMGVPVVALQGEVHHARVSASLLNGIDRSEWVARSPEEYVQTAMSLSQDLDGLKAIRNSLRGQMRESALCDREDLACAWTQVLLKVAGRTP